MAARRFLCCVVLGLSLAASPAQGQSAPVAWLTDAAGRCELALGPAGGSPPTFLTASDCSASCGFGQTVSAHCPGMECRAQDQDCAAGIRGFAECVGVVRAECSPCPSQTCTAQRTCPDGSFIQCQGTPPSCSGGGSACFVLCNGAYTFCPGHEGEFSC
jgi:hypothetical protein